MYHAPLCLTLEAAHERIPLRNGHKWFDYMTGNCHRTSPVHQVLLRSLPFPDNTRVKPPNAPSHTPAL